MSKSVLGLVWIALVNGPLLVHGVPMTLMQVRAQEPVGRRPNVLFVLTDDQRWDCYHAAGNDRIRTPNLDRIAQRGVRFKNAFVTLAICSPSRAACLTGRYGSCTEVFEELYDLKADAEEVNNVAHLAPNRSLVRSLADRLNEHRRSILADREEKEETQPAGRRGGPPIPENPPIPPRTDLHISGVYPHLTTYGVYSQNGAHYKAGHNECGIGAVVPWAGKLWLVNYAPHQPKGSEHKLYSIDPDPSQPIMVHPESVGGTPAGRMIHRESNQLLIGHYLIDSTGTVRVISPKKMPIRITAITRHLTDPENRVYYIDMEGSIWESDVHTLAVHRLFKKPVPGWHAKGGYTSQGRLVIANNGELHVGNYDDVLVGGKAVTEEDRGVLAEFDGQRWAIVERRQFTDVTGPAGIAGGGDEDDPIWAIGWDRRSLRLKLLEDGRWYTYLLPKAAYCNDASHGWYTEWPRIREITDGRWMMDMHGMFFNFPKSFSFRNSAGITPIGSHLRYVPDFCAWQGKLVLATDETSIQGNRMAGQPQSNLWFGHPEELENWGPASGYGGPWVEDPVVADTPSDPFLIAGFDRRVLHLAVGRQHTRSERAAGADAARPTAVDPDIHHASGKEAGNRRDSPAATVTFTLQVDRDGTGRWSDLQRIRVPDKGAVAYVMPSDLDAVWLRLKTNRDCVATAFLHQTTNRYLDGRSAESRKLFAGLAGVGDTDVCGARLYPAKRNRNLRLVTDDKAYFEFTKAGFEFEPDRPDPKLDELLRVDPAFRVDKASVVIRYRGQDYRLPKGDVAFDQPFSSGWPRTSREVESERKLANIHGTFYEVPLVTNGAPPAWNLMRPVASHSKQITDFCSWNGLLVLAGVRSDASNDGHVFSKRDGQAALWFGGIDDLWKMGKPVGHGGPWFDSQVVAEVPSDPYLMTGYDRKSFAFSHQMDGPLTLTLQIDVNGNGLWVDYRSFPVTQHETLEFEFPVGFSACWVRAVCDSDTRATLMFTYR